MNQEPEQKQDKGIDDDPDIIAEKKKSLLLKLRLERYIELSNTIGVIIRNFRAEALSLVSGVGTLVLGWFQIKKWVLYEGEQPEPVTIEINKWEAGEDGYAEEGDSDVSVSGEGIGLGTAGTIGHGAGVATGSRTDPTYRSPGSEVIVVKPSYDIPELPSMMTDTNTYIWVGLIGTFIWSSIVAWVKKKKHLKDELNKQL